MFPQDASQNTFEPLYELTNSIPNWSAWNATFLYGTPQLMIYLTDLLTMILTGGKRNREIQLAFIPMKTS